MNQKNIVKDDTFFDEIKNIIIETLNLEGMTAAEISTEAPLFGDGLGLDSIDALELGLALKSNYGVVLSAESEATRQHFYSIETLAEFIVAHRLSVGQSYE